MPGSGAKNIRATVILSVGIPRARRVISCIIPTQPWPQWYAKIAQSRPPNLRSIPAR